MEHSRKILVQKENLNQWVDYWKRQNKVSVDTETYGLRFKDEMFSLILSNEHYDCYFNFKSYVDLDESYIVDFEDISSIFDSSKYWYLANAKFDMQRLWLKDVWLFGTIHDISAAERLLVYPDKTIKLGLDACAQRRGWKKDDRVEEWITSNKAISRTKRKWSKGYEKVKHYNLVPFDLISEYGCKDGELTYKIGERQLAKIEDDQREVLENECRLVHTCFKMENKGIAIDTGYVERALAYEMGEVKRAEADFVELTGVEFKDSAKVFQKIVEADGIEVPKTDKDNPSFSDANLDLMDHPIVDIIRRYRIHSKYAGTYYGGFLHHQVDGVLHPDMRQAGTVTGRFSYRDPNLQNVPKEDENWEDKKFLVRKSFVPFEGMVFVMIDYKQQEYRMMVDYAGETRLIQAIKNGEDLHSATASIIGKTRKKAKAVNFSLLYGQGTEAFANNLGVSKREGRIIRDDYFRKLPKVEAFLDHVARVGRERGFLRNWLGRYIRLQDRRFAYKLPNSLIQGGCADVLKVAMNKIDDHMIEKKMRSFMQLQVHDELLFGFVPEELGELQAIIDIMENVYPSINGVKLEVDVEHSWKSWGQCDRVKGLPQ